MDNFHYSLPTSVPVLFVNELSVDGELGRESPW